MQVRVREVVGTIRAVDGDSLLSPQVLERIVAAVLDAVAAQRGDAASRARDTKVGAADCGCESEEGAH